LIRSGITAVQFCRKMTRTDVIRMLVRLGWEAKKK
jgi:hypothetical protein